jgi:ABC-2 type transport system ATP-binding protein
MGQKIIEAKGLTKKFGDFTAVDGIDFSVEPGEIFAFLGPNGAGKSTTIKMMTTMLRPTSGSLRLAGHDVTKERDSARKAFGIVFQDPSLDEELSAYENMDLHATLYSIPKPVRPARIQELLTLVELWGRKDSMIKTFSGGMRRRLEIARGLLHEPRILFLDEPTLGLDTQTRNLMWNYVRKLSNEKGMTIFFTTHYLDEAEEVAERVAIIDHGTIMASGTTKQLTQQTKTKTLEEAYLKLTGTMLRDDDEAGNNNGLNFKTALRNKRLG